MIELIKQWYINKVASLKAQNGAYNQLSESLKELENFAASKEPQWLSEGRADKADLQESSNIVQDTDNLGWLMTSKRPEYKGHVPSDQEAMIFQARRDFRFDCNARAVFWTLTEYIMGPGVKITPQSEDPRVHKLWREFWNSPRNKMALRQFEIVWRTMRDGECLIQFFTKDENQFPTWKTTVRFRDPLLLKESPLPSSEDPRQSSRLGVQVDPDDPETVLNYWFANPYDMGRVASVPAEDILHIKIFADMDQKRGESYIQPIMQMVEHYRQWLKYRIILNKVRSSIVLVRKMSGGTATDITRISNQLSQSATEKTGDTKKTALRPGTVLNANAGIDYQFLSPNINASDVAEDARKMKLEMAAGTNLPEYVFGDASNSNLASTMISEAPFVKNIKFWQTFFEQHFKDMFRRVIQAAVDAGKLVPPKEDDIFNDSLAEAKDMAGVIQPPQDKMAPNTGNVVTQGTLNNPPFDSTVIPHADETDPDASGDNEPDESENKLAQQSGYEKFFGCDVQWPEIVHRDVDKTTTAIIQQVQAGLVSEPTASAILGYDYEEEIERQKMVEETADDNPFKQAKLQQQAQDAADLKAQTEQDGEMKAAQDMKNGKDKLDA